MNRLADLIYTTPETVVWEALGLILSGLLVLMWVALKLTPPKSGA